MLYTVFSTLTTLLPVVSNVFIIRWLQLKVSLRCYNTSITQYHNSRTNGCCLMRVTYSTTSPAVDTICDLCLFMAVLWNRVGHYIFVLWFLLLPIFFLAYSQPSRIGCLPYFHTWCGLSGNLECRSEMCCTRLAGNAGRKKSPKIRHLRTIAQHCRAISSQRRHVLTIGKKLAKQQYLLYMSPQYGELGPLTAEICWRLWGTPANFNVFRVLAALLLGTLVVGVSQTLQRWTKSATYIRQGGHHVGNWPTF